MKALNKVNVVNEFSLTTVAEAIAKAHSTKGASLEALNANHKEWYLKDNADIQDIYSAFSKAYFATRDQHGVGTYERIPSDQKGKEKLAYRTPEQAKAVKNKARLVTFTVADILDCVPKEAKKVCGTKGAHQGVNKRKHDKWFSKIFKKLKKEAEDLDLGETIKEAKRVVNRTYAEKFERATIGSKKEVLKNSLDILLTNDKHLSDSQKASIREVMKKANDAVQKICK